MKRKSDRPATSTARAQDDGPTGMARLAGPVFLVATMAAVRYFQVAGFGLYEDDLTQIPAAAQKAWPELAQTIWTHLTHFYGQGHPLHLPLIELFSVLGWRLGDLMGAYTIGWALISLNVVLFFLLLSKVHSPGLGLLAGLAYVLYSADTTQAYLTYSFGIQPALMLLLLSLHLYIRGRRVPAYGLMFVAILIYETTFAVFAAAPLLWAPWDGKWRRQFGRHAAILLGVLALDLALRLALKEDRVGNLTLSETLTVPLLHMFEGPPVALGTYLYRPFQVLMAGWGGAWIVAGVAFAVFSFAILRVPSGFAVRWARWRPPSIGDLFRRWPDEVARLPTPLRAMARMCVAGFAMLVLAYPFTFTVRAYAISGRDTRVHAAGVVGAALFVGSATLLLLWLGERYGLRRLVGILVAAWLGLMAGYGFLIQHDYVRAWELQKEFWSALVEIVPDASEGTVILVDPKGLEDTRQIGANYWNLPRVLEQLYDFPAEWEAPPRVYRLEEGWEDGILTPTGLIHLDATTTFSPPSTYGDFDPAKAVLILTTAGRLERVSGSFRLPAGEVFFRPAEGAGEPPYPRAFLSKYLIAPAGGPPAIP